MIVSSSSSLWQFVIFLDHTLCTPFDSMVFGNVRFSLATLPAGSTFSIAGMKISYRSVFNVYILNVGCQAYYFHQYLSGIPPGFSQCLISAGSLQWRKDTGWWFLERNKNHFLLCLDQYRCDQISLLLLNWINHVNAKAMAWFMATLPGGSTFSIAGMKISFSVCSAHRLSGLLFWIFPPVP